jgi:flagellar M-ring protein FliF
VNEIATFWSGAGSRARVGMLAGTLAVIALTAGIGHWALSKNYEVLFADLSSQDAATMVAELDRMKLPYRLEAGGTRIAVAEDVVHKTRLHLVGKNLPLHGAVGFEIFNNTDFGMTEFSQKVNYQRALQGELTRTIMALDEVQAARVHLVLPESSLFKRDQNRPKASVTLALKPGRALERDQVSGIQRLVAAAVSGVEMGDVTVLDQRGVTLSRRHEGGVESAGWQLETKRQIEDHLARKISAVLDRAFGAGQGVVSVDAVVNFDQVKITTEEVLGSKAEPTAVPTGVVVRERQSVREAAARAGDKADPQGATSNTETDYQAGRRVEQIVGTPGSLRRLNVGVVVPRGVDAQRLEHVRQVVAMAAGLDKQRGDGIAVYSLDQVSIGPPSLTPAAPPDAPAVQPVAHPKAPSAPMVSDTIRYLAIALGLALLAGAVLASRRHRTASGPPAPALGLSDPERAALLQNVQRWLEAPRAQQVGERAP